MFINPQPVYHPYLPFNDGNYVPAEHHISVHPQALNGPHVPNVHHNHSTNIQVHVYHLPAPDPLGVLMTIVLLLW